jgi:hypothetical protein
MATDGRIRGNEDRFRHISRNKGRTLPELLSEFRQLRERNVSELRGLNLTEAQLRLTGEHPAFGTVRMEQLLATWVAHDLGHVAQIARVMAKQYRGHLTIPPKANVRH